MPSIDQQPRPGSSIIPTVLKCGWLDKEIIHGYLVFAKYSPRYVVLTQTFIRYYHNEVPASTQPQQLLEDNNGSTIKKNSHAFTEISLLMVNENVLQSIAHREPDIVHIEESSTGKVYRFRGSTIDIALQWRLAIVTAKSKLVPPAKVHFKTETDSKAMTESEMEQNLVHMTSEWHKQDNIIQSFEDITFCSIDRVKFVADSFFESLSKLTSKERTNFAKEMGKALIAWLDGEPPNTWQQNQSHISKIEVLTVWLRVALSREFLNSCKFDESGGAVDDGDASSESSSMTHSTIKSRMRNAKKGSIIMPFRADTGECLFISAIFHSSCIKDNTLHFILHSALSCISSNPENYTFPKPMLVVPQSYAPTEQTHLQPPEESGDKSTGSRFSFARRSTRFFGLVRTSMRFSQPPVSGRSNSKDSTGDSGSRPQSFDGRNIANLVGISDAKSEQDPQHLAQAELALLSPIELKRLEVRRRLLDVASAVIENFQSCSDSGQVPLPIDLIIKTIRSLIISSPSDKDGDHVPARELADNEDESEGHKNRKRFEYGTYFTSCSALLFLRLICRAIISPDDYGVTDKGSISIYDSCQAKVHWPHKSFAPMVVLAHTLFSGEEIAKNEPNTPAHKKDYVDSIQLKEMQSCALSLRQSVPREAIFQYMELFHAQKKMQAKRDIVDGSPYQFDWTKPSTRWALAEVAKAVQHIANISCLPKDEMQSFARDSLLRQNIAAGMQDKDSFDTHVFTGLESEAISAQISIASRIKEVYEKLGDLPPRDW